jgi:hypothetical protein
MARPRRSTPASSSSSSAYQRRNERARAAGFKNYYDQRVRGGVGRARPDAAAPSGAELARARGHRGTADLVRTLRPGDVIVVPNGLPDIVKDAKGRYSKIEVMVLRDDGSTDRFTIRRKTYEQMAGVLEKMAAKGAMFSPSPSLDLRRLVRVADRLDVDEEDEDE